MYSILCTHSINLRIVKRTWLTRLSAASKRVCSSLSLVCTLSSSLSCSLIFFCSAPSSSSRYPPESHRYCMVRLVRTAPRHEAPEPAETCIRATGTGLTFWLSVSFCVTTSSSFWYLHAATGRAMRSAFETNLKPWTSRIE